MPKILLILKLFTGDGIDAVRPRREDSYARLDRPAGDWRRLCRSTTCAACPAFPDPCTRRPRLKYRHSENGPCSLTEQGGHFQRRRTITGWASTLCVAVPTGWCTLLSTIQPPPLGEKRLVSSVQVLAVKFVQSSAAQETGKPVRHRIYPSEMSTAHTSTTHAARVRRQGSDLLPKHLVSSGPLHAGRRPRRPRRRETGSKRGAGRRRVFRVRVYFSFFLATALPLRTSTFSLPRTFLTLVLRSLRALRARPEGCLDQAIGIENERLLISYL